MEKVLYKFRYLFLENRKKVKITFTDMGTLHKEKKNVVDCKTGIWKQTLRMTGEISIELQW